jgi:tellurite resistance protein TerC
MQTIAPLWLWATFVGIVLVSLFVDFVVLKKQGSHDIGVKEALNWSLVWIALSFLFNGLFWWAIKDATASTEIANTKSLEFLTGYLIEKSLAVDNIFLFLMIFSYFAVPTQFQKRVLMIGIIGAIVLRTIMILVGGGRLAVGPVPLDFVRVWRFPNFDGHQDVDCGRPRIGSGQQPSAQSAAQVFAGQQELRR